MSEEGIYFFPLTLCLFSNYYTSDLLEEILVKKAATFTLQFIGQCTIY